MFDISNYFFFIEMAVASLVIAIPFQRREGFYVRTLLSVGAILVLSGVVPNGTVKFCVITIAVCMMLRGCYQISWKKAIYNTVCAYALQHLTYCMVPIWACIKSVFLHMTVGPGDLKPSFGLRSWILHIVVYSACYILFFRRRRGNVDVSAGQAVVLVVAALAIVLVLNSLLDRYQSTEQYGLFLICYAYDMLGCIIIFCLDDGIYRTALARSNYDLLQYLWRKRQGQYVIAENNMKVINTKCHELRQYITRIQESGVPQHLFEDLEELKQSIGIYDAVVKTGNEVLDVVLTEKSLYCQAEQITLACIVDGKSMDLMEPMDIYLLFETLLNYAVEEVCRVEDGSRRQIAITVWTQCGLLMIQFENYCADGARQEELQDYDREGIEYMIRRYKGTMTTRVEGTLIVRSISIPMAANNRSTQLE